MTSKQTQESTFERTDANPRAITWAAVALLCMLALAGVVVAGVRHFFSPDGPNYQSAKVEQKHLFEQRKPLKQAPPGVEIWPEKELEKVRQIETKKLSQYLWADTDQTYAWIPVDRAIEIIVAENQDSDETGDKP